MNIAASFQGRLMARESFDQSAAIAVIIKKSRQAIDAYLEKYVCFYKTKPIFNDLLPTAPKGSRTSAAFPPAWQRMA
jgi:hypothetical protein